MRLASTQALFAFLCVEARIGLNGLNGLNSLDPYPIGFDTEGLDLPLDDSFMNCMHGHEHRFYAGEVWTERGEIKHVDVENMENARQAGICKNLQTFSSALTLL